MALFSRNRTCFIIGPMGDGAAGQNARLRKLAREVIKPLLDEFGSDDNIQYKVMTPWDLGGNHIMNDVIYQIDRADIIVADLTNFNPNVFYELGIAHALGRPCISVMEDIDTKIPFDLSGYRIYKIDLDNDGFLNAQRILREVMKKAHKESDWAKFENPVIDFFNAPITYISPAFSLANGYYHNFIKPVVESLIMRIGDKPIFEIGIGSSAVPHPRTVEDSQLLDAAVRRKLELSIVIPSRIEYTKRHYADKLRDQLTEAVVQGSGRNYTCFYRSFMDDTRFTLVDIPTTLSTMEDAVARRMKEKFPSRNSPEWMEIEEQEIERFILNLQRFIDMHDRNPEFRNRIRILRYDVERPGELLWFHRLLFDEDGMGTP